MVNSEVLNAVKKVCGEVVKKSGKEIMLGLDVGGDNLWNGRRYEYRSFSRKESKRK